MFIFDFYSLYGWKATVVSFLEMLSIDLIESDFLCDDCYTSLP